MFAVPGWSVSASTLKPQTAPIAGQVGEQKKSKKRKRNKDQSTAAAPPVPSNGVTSSNVGDLWAQHVEGRPKQRPANGADKKNKKRRISEGEQSDNKAESDVLPVKTKQKLPNDGKDDVSKPFKKGVEQKDPRPQAPNGTKQGKDVLTRDDNKDHKKARRDSNSTPKQAKPAQYAGKEVARQNAKVAPAPPSEPKLTPMQQAMRQKLVSARFRHLNQTLYTATSATSQALFAENPEMFEDYHSGFRQQVSVWPENPIDNFIQTIRNRGRAKPVGSKAFNREAEALTPGAAIVQPLPRTKSSCTIADLGCGDARLSKTLQEDRTARNMNLKVLSYDLQSNGSSVTKADIANLPLVDGSVDVAVFCLALMGTNWIDFVEEAYRILHWKGELWIAEIKSRFGRVGGDKGKGRVVEHSVGSKKKVMAKQKAQEAEQKKKTEVDEEQTLQAEVDGVETSKDETDVQGFVQVLARRGFVLKEERGIDLSNKMFVKMEFIKAAMPTVGKNVRAEVSKPVKEGEGGTWKQKAKAKFLDAPKEVSVEDEAKVLKPCLYKIR